MIQFKWDKKHDWIRGGFEFLRVDNVVAGAAVGTGPTFATDDIVGVMYPRTKIAWGVDGAAVDASASNPFPVVQTGTPALPTGAATEATLAAASGKLPATLGQKAMTASMAVTLASDQSALPITDNSGSVTTDTPQLPSTIGQKAMAASVSVAIASDQGAVPVSGTFFQATQPVSAAALPLPTGAATETTLAALNTKTATAKTSDYDTGAGTDTVPMMGIALPASGGAVQGGTATNPVRTDPTGTTAQPITDNSGSITIDSPQLPAALGQSTMANGMRVSIASDQSAVPASQSGTWTVQPGNTANTTAWKVDNSAVNQPVVGAAAHGASVSGNPVLAGIEARSTDGTAVTSGQVVRPMATVLGKQVVMPYAQPGAFWSYAGAAGGLVTTAGVTAKAAGGVNVINYITSIQVINSHQTIGTEVCIKDGAGGTVLHRGWAQFAGGGYACKFDPPLKGTANTLVEIAEVTATGTAGVLVNLQGYTGIE